MTDLEKPADFGNFSRLIQAALTTFARASHKLSPAPWNTTTVSYLGGARASLLFWANPGDAPPVAREGRPVAPKSRRLARESKTASHILAYSCF
jgi:hypothetical protein